MDGDRGDGRGGEPLEVEDEFACSGMLRGSLSSLHGTVERIFGVTFGIGVDDPAAHGNNGQIWLKLRGPSDDVEAAKLFVKGLVNQEEQQEVSYPGVLHCIFCGARGLFMDCLTKNTSAHIVVGSPGFLLISGLAEPVVRAYSLITDLLERCDGTQSRRSEAGDKGLGESLDSRRAFKAMVEKWEDSHTLDLLVLPGAVKEILLELVRESGLRSSPVPALTDGNAAAGSDEELEDVWVKPLVATYTLPEPSRTTDRWVDGLTAGSEKDSEDTRGRAEGAEGRLTRSLQEAAGEQQELGAKMKKVRGEEEGQELQLSVGNKEFWLQLQFFTAMGYTPDVVKRVLARTGPKEASQILDMIQQEQDHSDREQTGSAASSQGERNRPCETEHREEEDMEVVEAGGLAEAVKGATGDAAHSEGNGGAEEKEEEPEEDFVLGVVKKAAASCGYMEQAVDKVYSMLPERSTHQLLLELQREGSREAGALKKGPREMDDAAPEKDGPRGGAFGGKSREVELLIPAEKRKSDRRGCAEGPDMTVSEFIQFHKLKDSQTPHQVVLPEVKGPPMPTYPSCLNLPLANIQPDKQCGQTNYWPKPSASKPNHPTQDVVSIPKPKSSSLFKQVLHVPQPTGVSARNDSSPTRARERRGFPAAASVVVTGEQRFMEGLQMPFDLQLTDRPGDPKVRAIIIDGSNVAMSHGLGHFFSCRGIALAVQHFWDRGHRHISALLPQWRQKSDPKIKEQHYLSELQELGLISYTPSREVQGRRIASYDDRFMLQHAQKTDGVIVTNDNLRDLSDESPAWMDIVKKRLLQYTFVGDHFMVPDDPLGRGGPHLDDFLRCEHRTPVPGNHSFAGAATTFPSSKHPRSQTELLNFRDRTPGGGALANGAAGGGSRSKGRGHGKGWGPGQPSGFRPDRSPEETASLREQLCQVFPGQDNTVAMVLQLNPAQTDINVLSDRILQ